RFSRDWSSDVCSSDLILGGLQAVMITDTIQGILLLTVGAIIFFMVFAELGSWQAVHDAAPEGGMSVIRPADDDFFPWPGIMTGRSEERRVGKESSSRC